jgi:hypothetical protein
MALHEKTIRSNLPSTAGATAFTTGGYLPYLQNNLIIFFELVGLGITKKNKKAVHEFNSRMIFQTRA